MEEIKSVINMCYHEKFDVEELNNRRLYINYGIDETIIDTICFHIMRYNREDIGKPVNERVPIKLYINSNGGDVYNGWALISVITSSITPVITINQGMCASMAFLIFIAGHKRYSMENAVALMHEGYNGGYDSSSKMRDKIDFETGQLEAMTKDFVLNHTNITSKFYDEKYRIEWYLLPNEAKKYGICDAIVGKDCSIEEIL